MTIKELINKEKNNPNWTSKKVFMCYSNEKILRLISLGEHIADGELFKPEELEEYDLNKEIKATQWWYEGGDLCIDLYKK